VPVPFRHPLRVRYVECDMQGRVFNGHYLTWFDLAHTELLREALGSYADMVASGVDLVVAESGVRYLASAHYDDELEIGIELHPPTTTSLTSRFTIRRDGEVITTGFLRHVCVDTETYKKRPWPDDVRAALEPYVVEPDEYTRDSPSNVLPSRPT
jgi:acyl-CoA thioester hydrolase